MSVSNRVMVRSGLPILLAAAASGCAARHTVYWDPPATSTATPSAGPVFVMEPMVRALRRPAIPDVTLSRSRLASSLESSRLSKSAFREPKSPTVDRWPACRRWPRTDSPPATW